MLYRSNSNVTSFDIGDPNNWSPVSHGNHAGAVDLKIELDTTAAQWTSSWYINGGPAVRSETYTTNPTINYVGLARENGAATTFSSFTLTGPVPSPPPPPPPNPLDAYTHISQIGPGYAGNTTNATSYNQSSVMTVGNQQYLAYYEPAADGGNIVVASRTLGSDNWTQSPTNFTAFDLTDSHDTISMAIDGDGVMHLSWGMHSNRLQYAHSTASVTTTPGAIIGFTDDLGTNGMTGGESSVTYPRFLKLPDGDLLFFYRKGGSGNGDTMLTRYDTDTDTWTASQSPLIDGTSTGDPSSSNPYLNTPVLDANGDIQLTWSNRWNSNNVNSFNGFQTNHDLMFARSTDDGATWQAFDGTPYGLPITQGTSDVVVPIAQGSSLINQTSMTVDQNNRPIVATWYAPEAGSGNHVRQFMLAWYDGTDWQTSAITDFDTDYAGGTSQIPESQTRNYRMSRPTVLVDQDDRVLVLFTDYRMGQTLMLAHSTDRVNWEFLELDDAAMGMWEPTYDLERWQRDGVISMLYQPGVGVGSASEPVSLFEFDAQSYFAIPEPGSVTLLGLGAAALLLRRR